MVGGQAWGPVSPGLIGQKYRSAIAAALMVLSACVMLAGCTTLDWRPLDSGTPHVSSFMGVSFGEELADVRQKYPMGTVETSPYGAPAYKLVNQRAGSVLYNSIVYEFAHGSGMQLAYATFSRDSRHVMFDDLRHHLGPPTSISRGTDHEHGPAAASWILPSGETVAYNREADRLVILGPKGSSLKADIRLREKENS